MSAALHVNTVRLFAVSVGNKVRYTTMTFFPIRFLRFRVRAAATAATATGIYFGAMPSLSATAPKAPNPPLGSMDESQQQGDEYRDFTMGELHRHHAPREDMFSPASTPGKVGLRKSPNSTHVVRIALTGGPCAGKSSALATLSKNATAAGFDVYVAPECATILFNSGIQWIDRKGFQDAFIAGIVQMQLQVERTFTLIAASTGRPTILVMDRGIMDSKGYCSGASWEAAMLQLDRTDTTVDITEKYVLGRYDGVIHMCTAAKGAEK